jgi:crotonobetainyl-CoA:carnitine CoA-transferase CaiB-like acyl-CoA transferase
MCSVTSSWLLSHIETKPMGAMQTSIVPYQIFRCADGMMVIGAPNERLWAGVCRTLGREDLVDDPRFAKNELRVQHRDELIPMLETELIRHPRCYWMEALEREQVPCGPVMTTGEILSSDGVRERGAVVMMDDPERGPTEVLVNPMRFAGTELRMDPPPRLGEHTDKVLRELGLE